MLNFWPYFSLNMLMYKSDLGVARPLAEENSTINELKIPNIMPLFVLL